MDLDAPIPESLAHIVPSLVWWPDGQAFYRDHAWAFLNRSMALASDEHLAEIRAVYSDDDLRAALQHAQPGIFNLSAWEYWNHTLGVDPIPELPRRFISQSESVAADPDCDSFIVCRSR
jgi:hypothetical protein